MRNTAVASGRTYRTSSSTTSRTWRITSLLVSGLSRWRAAGPTEVDLADCNESSERPGQFVDSPTCSPLDGSAATERIAWRRQAAERGGLSQEARERALALAQDVELRVRPPAEIHRAYDRVEETEPVTPAGSPSYVPAVGTTLVRQYRGSRIEVHVRERGFEWDGKEFRSLTAVAEAITGSAWNGPLFFGLSKRRASK